MNKKLIVYGLIIGIVFYGFGSISGYDAGFSDGNATGYQYGNNTGLQIGYDAGFSDGNATGYVTGYNDCVTKVNQEREDQNAQRVAAIHKIISIGGLL